MKALRVEASDKLRSAGIETAQLDVDIILGQILQSQRSSLIAESTRDLTDTETDHFWQLISRRSKREPLAYLLQKKEFWGLQFLVDPSVLIPRPETEMLVEKGLEYLLRLQRPEPLTILDLCTGSGCVITALATTLRERGMASVMRATDISRTALVTARRNAELHGVLENIHFIESNMFQAIDGRFDLIVTNPPYLSSVEMETLQPELAFEPSGALLGGKQGTELCLEIITAAPRYLKPGGLLLLEHGAGQGEALRNAATGYFGTVHTYHDLQGHDRVLAAQLSPSSIG